MRRLVLGIAALACTLLSSATAFADATPVQLMLTYMPNVSNTDTPAASGIAELVMQEGEFRISAAGLPHLDGADRYVAWLVNSQSNQLYRLGSFNTTEAGESVRSEDVLPDAIPNKQWNLLLVTVENSAEANRPSAKHSIAGTFPRSDRDPPPDLLPNTGGADDGLSGVGSQVSGFGQANWLPNLGLPALTLVAGAGAGYVLARRRYARPS